MALDVESVDLSGMIDMHVHTAPDIRPRFADDVDTARAARAAGMRAILLKSHLTLTADRAAIAEKVVGGIRVLGGLALNGPVGGLNPVAVELALRLGAREVWMPTGDAPYGPHFWEPVLGLTLRGEDGRILPAVYEIIDLVRDADAILGTGHLTIEETVALVGLARERGLRKIVVTHPEASFIGMPVAVQEEISGDDVFFERCYNAALPTAEHPVSLAEIAAQIRRVGSHSTVLATDLGQANNPAPVEGLRRYLAGLLAEGLSWQEIRLMAAENPAYLLGL